VKEFRKNVALAIDGGGIRGTMVAKALAVVEEEMGDKTWYETVRLTAGTSTGSIISAGIADGMRAEDIHEMYVNLGAKIFKRSWRTWPIIKYVVPYQYSNKPLIEVLRSKLPDKRMGDFWDDDKRDVVITVRDLSENRTRFVKSWKKDGGYKDWEVWFAVLCSSTVPTYFPVVCKSTVPVYFPAGLEGEFVDGGVGSYANPCYIAAYEAKFCLEWELAETTLISVGTGRDPHVLKKGGAYRFFSLQWIKPMLDTFLQDASDQQVRLVDRFFPELDFRRFQIDLKEPIPLDDPKSIPKLTKLGEELGRMIINDEVDEKAFEPKAGVARQSRKKRR